MTHTAPLIITHEAFCGIFLSSRAETASRAMHYSRGQDHADGFPFTNKGKIRQIPLGIIHVIYLIIV